MKRILAIAPALALCLFSMAGCGALENAQGALKNGEKICVAVTIVPEKTFVEAVCGDLADVVVMVPPGSSPENYEPTPKEMEEFGKASVYFSIGVASEDSILPRAGNMEVVALDKEAAKAYPERTFESGERDPHTWLSPKRAKAMVEAVALEMKKLDAANAQVYEKNAQAYMAQLDSLDNELKQILKDDYGKKFIVYHPSLGYLAEDYGLIMCALEEEGKESTAQHLLDMIDLARGEGIKAVFYQDEIDSSQSEAFAQEIGGKTVRYSPLDADYINNLKEMARSLAEVIE